MLAFLTGAGYVLGRIAVARNGEIVPKAQYDRVIMEDGDVVEVVSFVGGG
ncbi:MAG: sulfur carrier protein ThiS [Oscillospiraceae bacterium]|nr:sulfur carrier protein ThiS [Oscillospiraceae bacterium]